MPQFPRCGNDRAGKRQRTRGHPGGPFTLHAESVGGLGDLFSFPCTFSPFILCFSRAHYVSLLDTTLHLSVEASSAVPSAAQPIRLPPRRHAPTDVPTPYLPLALISPSWGGLFFPPREVETSPYLSPSFHVGRHRLAIYDSRVIERKIFSPSASLDGASPSTAALPIPTHKLYPNLTHSLL